MSNETERHIQFEREKRQTQVKLERERRITEIELERERRVTLQVQQKSDNIFHKWWRHPGGAPHFKATQGKQA